MGIFIGYPSFMAYQMMKGKKGNNDGFPSIPGMIARYSALGLTNEQMAENPVWKDLIGNGHDLQMKNFAWKGMSGVGGYAVDIDEWGTNSTMAYYERNSIKITATFKENASLGLLYHNIKLRQSCVLKVTGIPEGCDAFLDDRLGNRFYMSEDGVYEIIPSNFLAEVLYLSIEKYPERWYRSKLTIEQLPLYPGFILGDGVDDFAVTEKELNFEDTYTVYTAFIPFQVDPVRAMEMCGKDFKKDFYLYYSNTHVVYYTSGLNNYIPVRINQFHIIVCKRNKTNAVIKNLITGESKTFSVSELIDNPGVYYLWRYQRSGTSTAKTAIAGQTICNGYFSTDEDDEKVLDWYKKQYPWLFPDQAWTVVGKTNEDEDRATIANITGNGNDLVLSNFGFAEGSGYNEQGEYAGYLVTDGVDDKIVSSSFGMGKDFTVVGEWTLLQNINVSSLRKQSSFIIRNNDLGLSLFINKVSHSILVHTKSLRAFCSNGVLYKSDWTEQIDTTPQDITSSNSELLIASHKLEYDKIAFKNLAIYPTVLSKDDCIKAYNYLQTLKAK